MISDEKESLILKALTGVITPGEQVLLDTWLTESIENQKLFSDYQKLYSLRATQHPPFDSQAEWEKLAKAMKKGTAVKPLHVTLLRVAASLVLVALSVFMVLQMTKSKHIVHRSDDRPLDVRLHDGSRVILKPGSVLTHSSSFNDESRIVSLSGDAFFKVEENASRPFTIQTDGATIEVVGTAFMVKAVPTEASIEVMVSEGVVRFGKENRVELKAGTRGSMNRKLGTVSIKRFSPENILAWKNKRLVFDATRLSDVCEALNDYFNTSITLKNNALASCRFSSTFIDPTLEEVIEALSGALNLSATKQINGYELDGQMCK